MYSDKLISDSILARCALAMGNAMENIDKEKSMEWCSEASKLADKLGFENPHIVPPEIILSDFFLHGAWHFGRMRALRMH